MNNYEKNKQIEISFLENIINFIKKQLVKDEESIKTRRNKLLDSRKDMWENAPKSSDDFDKIPEMNNYLAEINYQTQHYEQLSKRISKYKDMLDSTYFGRFDFKEDGYDEVEKIYLGIHSLLGDQAASMLVYDWRSPIASLYYQFDLGRGSYESPIGTLQGDISLKRQYKIKDGSLKYFYDSSVDFKDDILLEVLSKNTSDKMKNIVETIQKDQDLIIRDKESQLLIVQGIAGSGKTSIALHRIAFLLYQGIGSSFHANNIMIISPSSVFSKYISNVLPELGEENVNETSFDNILSELLPETYSVESRNDMLENLIVKEEDQVSDLSQESLVFKNSLVFKKILDRFLQGQGKEDLKEDFLKSYKTLFKEEALFYKLAEDLILPNNIEDLIRFAKSNFNKQLILYEDAGPLAYLALRLGKDYTIPFIKHLVIDEAQDYYPLHYEILNIIFPASSFTILGDFNQSLEKNAKASIYDDIQAIFNKNKAVQMTLTTSYRSSYEINKFSRQFLTSSQDHKSFSRHGSKPEIIEKNTLKALHRAIKSSIDFFQDKAYKKIALICKSNREKEMLEKLFPGDLTIIPAYLAKGLEFDVVLVYYPHSISKEKSLLDNKLLYIAATRALHELKIFTLKEKS